MVTETGTSSGFGPAVRREHPAANTAGCPVAARSLIIKVVSVVGQDVSSKRQSGAEKKLAVGIGRCGIDGEGITQ